MTNLEPDLKLDLELNSLNPNLLLNSLNLNLKPALEPDLEVNLDLLNFHLNLNLIPPNLLNLNLNLLLYLNHNPVPPNLNKSPLKSYVWKNIQWPIKPHLLHLVKLVKAITWTKSWYSQRGMGESFIFLAYDMNFYYLIYNYSSFFCFVFFA